MTKQNPTTADATQEPKSLSAVQRQIHETIYKPLIRTAIAEVEARCSQPESLEEFTIAAVCKRFSELADEDFSSNRFRDILENCGFYFRRVTVIRELPPLTGTPE